MNNIKEEARKKYREHLGPKLALSFSFIILIYIGLSLSLLNPLLILFAFPLLFIPAYYAFQMMNLGINKKMELVQKNFFMFYRQAYSPQIRGIYRVLSAFWKGLLSYFLVTFIVAFIIAQIMIAKNPALIDQLEGLLDYMNSTQNFDIMAFFEANESIFTLYRLISGFGIFAFLLAFLHFIGRSSLTPYFTKRFPFLFGKQLNRRTSIILKLIRHEYNRDYYQALWHGPLLLFVGYAAGFFSTYFITTDPLIIILSSVAGALLFIGPYLPYFFDVIEELYKKYEKHFLSENIKKEYDVFSPDPLDPKE